MKKLILCSALLLTPALSFAGQGAPMMEMPLKVSQEPYQSRPLIDSEPQTRDVINDWIRDSSIQGFFVVANFNRFHFEFENGKHELSKDQKDKLMLYLLKVDPMMVFVAGFTDNKGGPAFNASLARKRADYIESFIKSFNPKAQIIKTSSNAYPGDPELGKRAEVLAI